MSTSSLQLRVYGMQSPFLLIAGTLDGDAAAEACRAVAQMVLARMTLLLALPMLAL